MLRLLDLFRFNDRAAPPRQRPFFSGRTEDRFRREERDAAILAGNYPPDGADIESISEYRLASLMQYPHY